MRNRKQQGQIIRIGNRWYVRYWERRNIGGTVERKRVTHYTGAFISSATYDISKATPNNAGFTQVNGTVAFLGIPWSPSTTTPSSVLLNYLNQNSSAGNTAALLQDVVHLGQTLTNLSRTLAGCR
jgi:hypothetical protein